MYILSLDAILAAFRWKDATRILHPAMQLKDASKETISTGTYWILDWI
jgi:hypothetical protein